MLTRKFKIADVIVEIECDNILFAPELDLFECNIEESADIIWKITTDKPPQLPEHMKWRDLGGFQIAKREGRVYAKYLVKHFHLLDTIIYENDYRTVTYYIPEQEEFGSAKEYIRKMVSCLFAFEREAFFLAMLHYNGISIHSVSIIYEEKGIIFSAMSGTGKSTHTNMWAERYQTPILDGDVTVCRIIDGKSVIYGLPWSGSSRLFLNQSVELRSVVFLEQAPKNEVNSLSYIETCKRLYARSFTSPWFEEICQKGIALASQVCQSGVNGYVLKCRPDYESVELMKKTFDNELS